MSLRAAVLGLIVLEVTVIWGACAVAETCTTQSQMKGPERDELASAVRNFVAKVQADDAAGIKAETVAEFAGNFVPMQNLVAETAPKLTGGAIVVDQIYLLDASQLKGSAGGRADAQFFCSLNRTANEAEFLIPGLAPRVYGFAISQITASPIPWSISMLLQREQGKWLLAGIYPRSTLAAGHDGLWYWREARRMVAAKQRWNAWLYYSQAEALLRPTSFTQSTHLDKLIEEQHSAAPPSLSAGIGNDVPLVVRTPDGKDYQFTGLGTDDTLGKEKIDVLAHLRVDQLGDAASSRKRNEDAMHALVTAYPELRSGFHGIWIVAEASGAPAPFATEQAMADLH